MVSGACFEPSMAKPSRFRLALVACPSRSCGALTCCFSSNRRIWRSSFRIWSACSRVMPWSFVAPCAPSGNRNASGSAAKLAYRRNFFMRFLFLFQDQNVLAVLDVFLFGEEVEVVGFNLLDDVWHVQAYVGHGAPVRHGLRTLVIFHYHQFATRLERFVDARQHLLGVIEVVVDVKGPHLVGRAFGQGRIGLRTLDESHVGEILVLEKR